MIDHVARLVDQAATDITSGRADAVAHLETRWGVDFVNAPPEVQARLLAIKHHGVERSVPVPLPTEVDQADLGGEG